ncbi:MAG: tetratricopeptide repeat protein [Spirochaetia bacterium]|jgi:tetratricopeptide (TPR) repeat protein|nr:tetratricopeptide repeat protein [Spirochaetia bacterium]
MNNISLEKILIDAADKSFEGKCGEAEKILAAAEEEFPESYLVHYNLGILFLEKGEPQKAIAALDKAEKLKENDYDIFNEKALAYQGIFKNGKAIEYYEKALLCGDQGHEKAAAYNNIGSVYFSDNLFSKAKEFFNKALSEDNSLEEARDNLALVNTYLEIIG